MKYKRRYGKKKKATRKRKILIPYYQASIKEIMQDLKIIEFEKREIRPKEETKQKIQKPIKITDEKVAIESLVILSQSAEKIEASKPEAQLAPQAKPQPQCNLQQFWQYYPYFLYQNYAYNMGQFGWYYN